MSDLLKRKLIFALESFRRARKTAFQYELKPPKISIVFGSTDIQPASTNLQERSRIGKLFLEFKQGVKLMVCFAMSSLRLKD